MKRCRQELDRRLATRRTKRRSAIRKMLAEAAQLWPAEIRRRRRQAWKAADMSLARQSWERRAKRWQTPALQRLVNRMARV